MRARGAIAFGVALIAFLVGGIYLGGHPSKLPTFAREAFTEEPTSLVAEASEIIKDNYFRKVGNTELGNASLQGMVRELRKRHKDRFSDYFSPESLEGVQPADRRALLGHRAERRLGEKRAARGQGLPRLARRRGRDRSGGHDRLGRRRIDRRARLDRSDEQDQGAGRQRSDGRRRRREDPQGERKDADPGGGRAAQRLQPAPSRPTARRSATCGSSPSAPTPPSSWPTGSKRRRRKAPKGWSSTCARTRAGCSTRRSRRPPSSFPKAKPW